MQSVVKRIAFVAATIVLSSTSGCVGERGNSAVRKQEKSQASKLTPERVSPTAGYVPDEACRECHQSLYDSYQDVGMARSYYPARGATPIEDFENNHYYHAASDRHYEMTLEDGVYTQTRYQLDANGKRFNEISVEADAIIGSGNHIRSYIHRTPAGEMYQMPLAWYSNVKRWRMNPGYDLPDHAGFQRKITRECMFCHNAYPTDLPHGSDEHWYPHVFPEELPHGIGCQRCHGPGAQHIEVASQPGATSQQASASIVNPAELTPELQEDVCMQCHLQPSSKVLSELVRAERTEFSYRPGQPLNEYRAMLDYQEAGAEDEERFEINHHSYRLRQSACYLKSSSPLNCTTCHDPHRKLPDTQRIAHYRSACLECHSTAECSTADEIESAAQRSGSSNSDQAIANCVSCHMPERRTHDVIHATMTDHKIVRNIEPESERLAPRREPPPASLNSRIFPYFEEDQKDGEGSMQLYLAIASAELGSQRAVAQLQAYVDAQAKDVTILPLAELSRALQKNGDLQTELNTLSRAVTQYPNNVQANLEMGMALAAANLPEDALRYYQRALAIGPPLPETHLGIGMSMLNRNDLNAAVKQFRESVRLRPHYPEGLLNLGIALFATQQWSEARSYLLRARAADPSFEEVQFYLDKIP